MDNGTNPVVMYEFPKFCWGFLLVVFIVIVGMFAPSACKAGGWFFDCMVAGSDWENSLGMAFRLIPPGSFQMGSPYNEADRYSDETQHSVTLTKGFWLGEYEVTQGEWVEVMGSNPSTFQGSRSAVDRLSWDECQRFISKMNTREPGVVYRLPTEAEWEYACRAGTTTPFHFGATISPSKVNCDGAAKGLSRKKPTDAGRFPANAWGLHDMHGNVWEWCQDWEGDYPSTAVTDPTGPSSGISRVLRGGSWLFVVKYCRSAHRFSNHPLNRFDRCNLGLRLVVSFPGAP